MKTEKENIWFFFFFLHLVTKSTATRPVEGPTSGPALAVTLHGHALFVVLDTQHAALLGAARHRVTGAPGQNHTDPAAVHVQVSPLPHVHVLRRRQSGTHTRSGAS